MSDIKESIENFIETLEKDYLKWYENATKRSRFGWYFLQYTVLICGFVTSILIAIFGDDPSTSWRIILIILPSIGSFSATILMQFKIQELWRIREIGRVTFLKLIFEGKSRMLKCDSKAELVSLLKYLHDKTVEIEYKQGASFFETQESKEEEKMKNPTNNNA